jgi:hypothetical protein
MKLTNTALQRIDSQTKRKLAVALNCTEYWVGKLLEKNKQNSKLTTPSALEVIRQETGLTYDQILERETINEAVQN